MADTGVRLDLYVAAYKDEAAAQSDWDGIKELAKDKVLAVRALVLVSRDPEGKVHIKDNAHDTGIGASLGAVGGAVVGLIFPPALLASASVGAAIGAGAGAIVDQVHKHRIQADVERTLPPGSSGIVALFEERWVTEVEKALARAEKNEKHHLHDAA